ncbi:Acyl-coenzyme A thioesterase 13 [Fusarium oxysporum f. sp. albedinis]|nr:Acyl-coenzyme A thioesterase 13 [Fusarium oxysporum f. sp. albedinis]
MNSKGIDLQNRSALHQESYVACNLTSATFQHLLVSATEQSLSQSVNWRINVSIQRLRQSKSPKSQG